MRPGDRTEVRLSAPIGRGNTRLFEAEWASKRERQEALDYQTATSDVLGVISRAPNQLQPPRGGAGLMRLT